MMYYRFYMSVCLSVQYWCSAISSTFSWSRCYSEQNYTNIPQSVLPWWFKPGNIWRAVHYIIYQSLNSLCYLLRPLKLILVHVLEISVPLSQNDLVLNFQKVLVYLLRLETKLSVFLREISSLILWDISLNGYAELVKVKKVSTYILSILLYIVVRSPYSKWPHVKLQSVLYEEVMG